MNLIDITSDLATARNISDRIIVLQQRYVVELGPTRLILDAPGDDPMDLRFARHADVIVDGDVGALLYSTHPEWDESEKDVPKTGQERRTVIHVAKIWVEGDGRRLTEMSSRFGLTPEPNS